MVDGLPRASSVSDLPLRLAGCGVPANKGYEFCCTKCRFSSSSPGPRQHTTKCLRWYQERTWVTFQCASPLCKREAAIGYKTCCRTCKSSLSAQHGPKCNRHWAETIRRDRPRLGPDPGARQDQWQISCDDTAGDADDAWTETDETEKAKPHFQPGEERNSLQAQPFLAKKKQTGRTCLFLFLTRSNRLPTFLVVGTKSQDLLYALENAD